MNDGTYGFLRRNKREMEGLEELLRFEFGQKIYKNVSQAAWAEWVDRQKMLLNEYGCNPGPPGTAVLVEQMEEFFFGAGSALPRSLLLHQPEGSRQPEESGLTRFSGPARRFAAG